MLISKDSKGGSIRDGVLLDLTDGRGKMTMPGKSSRRLWDCDSDAVVAAMSKAISLPNRNLEPKPGRGSSRHREQEMEFTTMTPLESDFGHGARNGLSSPGSRSLAKDASKLSTSPREIGGRLTPAGQVRFGFAGRGLYRIIIEAMVIRASESPAPTAKRTTRTVSWTSIPHPSTS